MYENNFYKTIAAVLISLPVVVFADSNPVFTEIWRHWHSGTEGTALEGGAEIVSYDSVSKNIFVVNTANNKLDVLNSKTGVKQSMIDLAGFGSPNSVSVYKGLVAVAIESSAKTDPGKVVFFDASTGNLKNKSPLALYRIC